MTESVHIVFVDFGSTDENSNSGIDRKKAAQINELKKLGNTKRVTYSQEGSNGFFKKLSRRLPLFPSMFAYAYSDDFDNTDVVYFRRSITDRYTVRLIKDIREHNPNCLILFEIPTYPYDKEMTEPAMYPLLLKERWNRRKLHKYIDRIVLVASNEPVVFGVPTITIANGIDFSITPLRKVAPIVNDEIHTIIVGNFTFWHGLDRLIEGLIKYYQDTASKRKFVLHVVGPLERVIDASDKQIIGLVDRGVLHLYGKLPFSAVEAVYDKVSLAFSSLGIHRIGLSTVNSSVKSREYGAKGLPVVSGSEIDYLSGFKYFLKVAEDESPVDIEAVIRFHDSVYSEDISFVADKIRSHAEKTCSSVAMMKPVIEYCRTEIAQRLGLISD